MQMLPVFRLARSLVVAVLLAALSLTAAAQVPAPLDRPYPGKIILQADATDLAHRRVHVHEHLTHPPRELVLLYPQWLPGTHSPVGPLDRLAGIEVRGGAERLAWRRDPLQPYALHVTVPAGMDAVDVDFDYLSPTSPKVGVQEFSREIALLEWSSLVLYPAGHAARRIPVEPSLRLPPGWQYGTALETSAEEGGLILFRATDLETFVDSPVYAGRYFQRIELDPGAKAPVRLSLFADRPELLSVSESQLQSHRDLVHQADLLFGSRHFAHYDFLLSLSDQVQQHGLEHHQSSENGEDPGYFSEWDKTVEGRDLLPHEYSHSWNGKFRRPADLWTPNYNVPMQQSLLWVYEGQTQYWGQVLAARASLWTREQALDSLALTLAYYAGQPGRDWRTMQDTTQDGVINSRRPQSWPSWQRFEEYYSEGQLVWLDVDTLIRERSAGRRSLDDFARLFFGVEDGRQQPLTYTFDDVVAALNAIEPYDWATLLRARVQATGVAAFADGVRRGGYRLVYTEQPSDFFSAADSNRKQTTLLDSVGLVIQEKDGAVSEVRWGSPAYHAGMTEGMEVLAVDGAAYSGELLRDAIRAVQHQSRPLELIVRLGERFRVVTIDYHGGLRYPHLERDPSQPALLDQILAPRK